MDFEFDLVIRGPRVVCCATGWNGPGAVAVRGDRIVAVGADLTGRARQVIELDDGVLLPGLIDFHAHAGGDRSKYGVDPDVEFLQRGVTTVHSQGDVGAAGWASYRSEMIERSRTRVRLAINLAVTGEVPDQACFGEPSVLDVNACCRAIESGGELIWGIAVNLSRNSCQLDPRTVLQHALEVSERTGKPLLVGLRNPPDWPLADQLRWLRSGDVVTYALRDEPWSLVQPGGGVRSEVTESRRRGVLFDACHGSQSFSFRVAEAMIADGFLPDTISSDFLECASSLAAAA